MRCVVDCDMGVTFHCASFRVSDCLMNTVYNILETLSSNSCKLLRVGISWGQGFGGLLGMVGACCWGSDHGAGFGLGVRSSRARAGKRNSHQPSSRKLRQALGCVGCWWIMCRVAMGGAVGLRGDGVGISSFLIRAFLLPWGLVAGWVPS